MAGDHEMVFLLSIEEPNPGSEFFVSDASPMARGNTELENRYSSKVSDSQQSTEG